MEVVNLELEVLDGRFLDLVYRYGGTFYLIHGSYVGG